LQVFSRNKKDPLVRAKGQWDKGACCKESRRFSQTQKNNLKARTGKGHGLQCGGPETKKKEARLVDAQKLKRDYFQHDGTEFPNQVGWTNQKDEPVQVGGWPQEKGKGTS